MTKEAQEGSTKILNFMTPGVGLLVLRCGHISSIVKKHYFFNNLLINSKTQIRQTADKVMLSKEGSIKIVNFMTTRVEILVLVCVLSHIVKTNLLFFTRA